MEEDEMSDSEDTVTLVCWTCEREFATHYGPGRPYRYCSEDCRNQAERVRRRMKYEQRAELRRLGKNTSEVPPVGFAPPTPTELRRY